MDLTWYYLAGYVMSLLVGGYALPFIRQRWIARVCAWFIALATILFSAFITSHQIPLIRMLIIVILQLISMKIVVAVETYSGENRLTVFQWIAFSLGWFGMRPGLFENLSSSSLPFTHLLLKGFSRILIGLVLLYFSLALKESSQLNRFFLPQLLLLTGLSFILHFGILNISTAVWRMLGVDVSELFHSPYKSRSLREFWGRRWNIAFSEMTAVISYRPLKTKIGVDKAMMISFLLSGFLHEIAISLPVRTGYGLPMTYFAIHAFAMYLESKSRFIQKVLRHNVLSRVWVMVMLILPMPILFHPTFIGNVLVPLRMFLLRLQ
jgi:alginate O-acetyltransferase complex protein AlgI